MAALDNALEGQQDDKEWCVPVRIDFGRGSPFGIMRAGNGVHNHYFPNDQPSTDNSTNTYDNSTDGKNVNDPGCNGAKVRWYFDLLLE
jgi:hypothetical protein